MSEAIDRGWSAKDVDPSEYVDDEWICLATKPGKKANPVRDRVLRLIRGGLTRDQMRRIAARTGYPYTEAWSGWNRGSMKGVWGALCHHTGTPWSVPGDYPTLRVVRDGRSDLQNSLCMFGLGRSGRIYLISEKLSWHAGAGEYNGVTDGAGYLAGIEAESDGKNWTPEEKDCYPRLVASILIEVGEGTRYTTRHASWALPRGRKTDFTGIDLNWFWAQVDQYLANPASIHKDYKAGKGFLMALTDKQQQQLVIDVDDIKAVLYKGNSGGTPPNKTIYQRLFNPGSGTHDHAVASVTEVRALAADVAALTTKVDQILAKLDPPAPLG